MIKQINICLNNTKKQIFIEELDVEENLLFQIKNTIIDKFNIDKDTFFLKDKNSGCLINNKYFENLEEDRQIIDIEVIYKLKGGIIDSIVNMLKGIITMFIGLFKILVQFGKLFILMMEFIPVVFDPPTLMNDVIFAVSYGIKKVFSLASESIKGSGDPEDDEAGKGPFGVSNSENIKCLDPSFSTILLLIVCPPMAIFFKLGFLKGFVSAIICGVLCVKLYYFPGLLFAILHVLC